MYNRAFPIGNALFLFAGGMMRLFRLPRGKFSLDFLAVPAGKDGRVVGEVYLIFVGAILQQPLYRFAQFFSIYTLVEGNAKSTPSACMMSIMFRFRSFCICKNSA